MLDRYSQEKIRKAFPILNEKMNNHPFVYLDSAATCQKPKKVIDALYEFYLKEYATVHRAVYQFSMKSTDRYQETRERIKDFIHAENMDEIVFTKGTTDSINLVAYTFGEAFIKQGDEIIISEMEHHSNLVPWQLLCARKKAILKWIPMNDKGELEIDKLDKLLTSKTKLVSVGHIANSTGSINPIETIIAKAHKQGAYVLIDGAQSISHIKIDVHKLDCDFYAFSSHKIYGPNGVGVLYGKKALLEKLPPFEAGGDMIDRVTLQKTTYREPPYRFEPGTPAIAEVIAFKDALDFVEEIGIENIALWEQKLLVYATEQIEKIPGVKIIGTSKKKASILSFIVDGIHPLDLGTLLDLKGIAIRTGHHCAQPAMDRFNIPGTARISLAVYNTMEEIDYFMKSLEEIIHHLKK